MYKLIENIHHGIPHKTIFQTDGNAVKLVKWSSSSDKKRPALVFIPGFLTECSATDELDIWTSRIRNIAQYYDLESWGLYWPSGNIDTLLGSKDWSLFMSASVRLSALPLGFTILPQILLYPAIATALGVGVMVAQRLLETWRKAVSRADEISMNPQWIQEFDRPIILVGHSLGGRIAIKTTSNSYNTKLLSTFALAPAVLESECDFQSFYHNQEFKGTVGHSINDLVLEYAFRIGEQTEELPLGFTGISNQNFAYAYSHDLSFINYQETRHNTYSTVVDELFIHKELRHLLSNL